MEDTHTFIQEFKHGKFRHFIQLEIVFGQGKCQRGSRSLEGMKVEAAIFAHIKKQ